MSTAMPFLSLFIRLIVLCLLVWLAVTDVRERRLPNKQVLLVAIFFFADAFVLHLSAGDLLSHFLVAVAVYVLCALLFAAKMLGGGDAKLAAAVFLWSGLPFSGSAAVLISVTGTFVALVSLATKYVNPKHRLMAMRTLALFSGARGVPYGVALALGGGAVIVLPALLPLFLTR